MVFPLVQLSRNNRLFQFFAGPRFGGCEASVIIWSHACAVDRLQTVDAHALASR